MHMTQSDMLALLRRDPERGLEAVVRAVGALALKTVRLTGGDALSPADAEEIVSDVFFRVYTSRDGIDESKGTLATFVITLAKRMTVDRLRARAHRQGAELPIDEAVLPAAADVEETVAGREERQKLVEAIVSLGHPDSTIVFRRYYYGESYKAIGKKLGLSENAVNKRCLKALGRLRQHLGKGE
jgi:RNA polymerase sigma-70 factor (ECF subfamily)